MDIKLGYNGEMSNVDLNTFRKFTNTGLYGCNDSNIITSFNHYPDDSLYMNNLVKTINQDVKTETNKLVDGSYSWDDPTLQAISNQMETNTVMVIKGMLEVIVANDESICMQRFYRHNDMSVFYRMYADGSWNEWAYEESYNKYTLQYANDNTNIRSEQDIIAAIDKYQPRFDDTALRAAINSKGSIAEYNNKITKTGDSSFANVMFAFNNGIGRINGTLNINNSTAVYFKGGSGDWRRSLYYAPSNNHLYMGSADVPTIWLNSPSGWVRDYQPGGHMGRFLSERDFVYKDAGTGTDITAPNEATEYMLIIRHTSQDMQAMAFAARGMALSISIPNFRWGNYIQFDGNRRFWLSSNPGLVFRVLWR